MSTTYSYVIESVLVVPYSVISKTSMRYDVLGSRAYGGRRSRRVSGLVDFTLTGTKLESLVIRLNTCHEYFNTLHTKK